MAGDVRLPHPSVRGGRDELALASRGLLTVTGHSIRDDRRKGTTRLGRRVRRERFGENERPRRRLSRVSFPRRLRRGQRVAPEPDSAMRDPVGLHPQPDPPARPTPGARGVATPRSRCAQAGESWGLVSDLVTSRAACEAAAYRDVSPDSAAGRSLCVTNSLGLRERCVVLAARAPVLCAVGSAKSHLHVDRGEIHNINTSPVDKMAVPHPEFRPKCLLKTPGAHPIPTRLEQILFTSGTQRG